MGNVIFIRTGLEPDGNFIRQACTSPEADGATFKIAFCHRQVYSAGSHGAEEDATAEAACDDHQVTFTDQSAILPTVRAGTFERCIKSLT